MAPLRGEPETSASAGARRHRVPPFLLGRFADASGRVMAERRDRGRRLTLAAGEAAAQAGAYTVTSSQGSADLARLLARIEERAAGALDRMVGGAFPPPGADRAHLSVFLSVALLLGRGYRAGVARTAEILSEPIVAAMQEMEATLPEADEGGAGSVPETERDDIELDDDPPVRLSLASLPALARVLSARTWQLARFPDRLLLTGDTPVVLWSRPGSARPYQFGLGAADEVRVSLDPRHALVLARRAPAGEVVRDLDERHARALNRTVAEAAHTWMYYHPDSDPLEAVELAPP